MAVHVAPPSAETSTKPRSSGSFTYQSEKPSVVMPLAGIVTGFFRVSVAEERPPASVAVAWKALLLCCGFTLVVVHVEVGSSLAAVHWLSPPSALSLKTGPQTLDSCSVSGPAAPAGRV